MSFEKESEEMRKENVVLREREKSAVKVDGRDSQNAGSGRPPPQNIVVISDSDDDDCAPVETLNEKGKTLLHGADNSHSDQIGVGNANPTPKRKRGESEIGDECEQQMESEQHMSRNLLNGFPLDGLFSMEESSSSSSSSSSSDTDSVDDIFSSMHILFNGSQLSPAVSRPEIGLTRVNRPYCL